MGMHGDFANLASGVAPFLSTTRAKSPKANGLPRSEAIFFFFHQARCVTEGDIGRPVAKTDHVGCHLRSVKFGKPGMKIIYQTT